jgi:formate--tetrahydrofolate ligase
MAIIALAKDRSDLRRRLENIVVGVTRTGKPVFARDFEATGAMMALLTEAIQPNLVQTVEGVPAFVHTGPFGNIAHGTSSVVSQEMGLRLADYVVNECGFAADLGAEKYIDIVYRSTGVSPAAAVLVTTVQSLRNQGEDDLEKGIPNLVQHLHILRRFGLPTVVAINRFPKDADADLERLERACQENGALSARHTAFANGGAGAEELARRVVEIIEKIPGVRAKHIYDADETLEAKIQKVAREVYGAAGATLSEKAKAKLQDFTTWGFGKLPVCVAKTQYSLSDNPKLMGAPKGWELNVTDATLSAGAGFVVVISGNMMLMPGLPKVSRVVEVDVDAAGEIVGI